MTLFLIPIIVILLIIRIIILPVLWFNTGYKREFVNDKRTLEYELALVLYAIPYVAKWSLTHAYLKGKEVKLRSLLE